MNTIQRMSHVLNFPTPHSATETTVQNPDNVEQMLLKCLMLSRVWKKIVTPLMARSRAELRCVPDLNQGDLSESCNGAACPERMGSPEVVGH